MPRIVALLACLLTSALAQTADWRFIHPDAKAFIGIKLQRVLQSPVAAEFQSQFQGQNLPDLPSIPELELFHQVDELFISSPGRAPDAAADVQPPLLIQVTGRFEAARVEALFRQSGAHMQIYRRHRVYRKKGDGDMAATLVDAHTLLVGDAPSLFAALERMDWSADATPRNPLLARALELDATSDLWAVFAVAPSSFTQAAQLPALESVRGMELSAAVTSGLTLRLALNTDSPASAVELATSLKQILAIMTKAQASSPEVASLGKDVRFSVENASVRVQFTVSPVEMKKALARIRVQAQQQARIAAHQHSAAPVAPVPLQPPPPPERRVIRIEGLDDGPREIPYQ